MNYLYTSAIDFVSNNWGTILWILVLFFLGKAILAAIIKRAVKLADDGDKETRSRMEKQADTLGQIIQKTGNIVIYVVILLMILGVFGVDITPILAGAGIIGLAVGFGAQTLVKDLVSGLFIFIEHQYSIGDKVKIADFEGEVVQVTMRSTALKGEDGNIFYIPNGQVTKAINYSQKDMHWKD